LDNLYLYANTMADQKVRILYKPMQYFRTNHARSYCRTAPASRILVYENFYDETFPNPQFFASVNGIAKEHVRCAAGLTVQYNIS
jgi:hypothetical protein